MPSSRLQGVTTSLSGGGLAPMSLQIYGAISTHLVLASTAVHMLAVADGDTQLDAAVHTRGRFAAANRENHKRIASPSVLTKCLAQ